jgi:hypothetical protein
MTQVGNLIGNPELGENAIKTDLSEMRCENMK